jgi:3-dehydroquinate dehydratase-2
MKIVIINGPNLNMLGRRDPAKYGLQTLEQVNQMLVEQAQKIGCELVFFQSNHEGAIIDFLQQDSVRVCNGVLINPGALVRYGYSLRQALVDLGKPVMEVHMSDINKTGVNKTVNVLEDIRVGQVTGLKEESYVVGLTKLVEKII